MSVLKILLGTFRRNCLNSPSKIEPILIRFLTTLDSRECTLEKVMIKGSGQHSLVKTDNFTKAPIWWAIPHPHKRGLFGDKYFEGLSPSSSQNSFKIYGDNFCL